MTTITDTIIPNYFTHRDNANAMLAADTRIKWFPGMLPMQVDDYDGGVILFFAGGECIDEIEDFGEDDLFPWIEARIRRLRDLGESVSIFRVIQEVEGKVEGLPADYHKHY